MSYRIYRATKNSSGVASEFSIRENTNEDKKFVPYLFFLSLAKQVGQDENENAKFDWEHSLKVKLNENDIGEILAVLKGYKDSLGTKGNLYHATPNGGNKVIKFNFYDGAFNLSVSGQDKDKNSLGQLGHSVTLGEAQILTVFLTKSLEKLLGL